MVPPEPRAPSRGKLVADFLSGSASAQDYAQSLAEDSGNYSGYNLLLYDGAELLFATNTPGFRVEAVTPGIHTVSNASLDTPWPKSLRLKAALEKWSADNWETLTPLFAALGDRKPAADTELPNTGAGKTMEKLLSPPFIVSPHYGTRCSTVVTLGADRIEFSEKRFEPGGVESGRTEKQLPLQK
jgi:uncharacterized protein with NRDE domain